MVFVSTIFDGEAITRGGAGGAWRRKKRIYGMEAGVQTYGLWTREKYLERIKKLRLMDDDFFSEALDGKLTAVEFILRTVLQRDDLTVVKTKAQVEYKSATKRSIRLDVEAVDAKQEHFDIEIQRAEQGAGARRARFHGSMIDRELLEKNRQYEELADEVKYLKETEGGREHMCRILEEMCEEFAEEVAEQVEKETTERVERETTERVARETAKSLLLLGKLSHEDISESTGLSLEVVEELAEQKTA